VGAQTVDHPPQKASVRFSGRAAWLSRDVMRSVLSEGTGKSAAKYGVGKGAAGKSGTTDDYGDAWFAGVSGGYSIVAWVGFDQPRPTGLTGGQAALPIWARFVDASGTDEALPARPHELTSVNVCVSTGKPPCGDCVETRDEWFTAGTEPQSECGLEAVPAAAAETVKQGWQKLGELFGLNR
jgi:membrane carboxypeptidase/penicillin-binding protein